jgi:uncharacterized protein (DUF1697 family)
VTTFVLLLRGINVGGRNRLPMADLRALVASLGPGDVSTHLQSGNVVWRATGTSAGTAAAVADRVATAVHEELGLAVPVVARTAREWSAVVAGHPFEGLEDDPKRLHVTFLSGVPEPDRVARLEAEAEAFAPDQIAVNGADVFLHVPASYADTPLQNAFLERRLDRVATTRNWRTVLALADLAGLT